MEIGCMASFSDVEALPETEEVHQQAKACDAEGALAATATEENEATPQEQHDDMAPVPDHHQEIPAPEQASEAPAAPAAPEEHRDEKDQVAAKEEVEPKAAADDPESTRERLKRHRREMAGRVWVPEMWGQEKLLKDWVDYAVFDRPLVPTGLLTARRALIAECCTRRPDRASSSSSSSTCSNPLRVRNGCS